jgi:hypothetical protein
MRFKALLQYLMTLLERSFGKENAYKVSSDSPSFRIKDFLDFVLSYLCYSQFCKNETTGFNI